MLAAGSPASSTVLVSKPLRNPPKSSSAAIFHDVKSQTSITYYEEIEICHEVKSASHVVTLVSQLRYHNSDYWNGKQGITFHFSIRDPQHCALVYYQDADGEGGHELAYIDIVYVYKLPGEFSG